VRMKIRTISRTEEDFSRKSSLDISKVHRNQDPALHPFDRAREYARAVVATKLDRIFAKPFIGALDGHKDAVFCMSTVRSKNLPFISGSCDGELKVWDLAQRKCFWSVAAHNGFVRGVAPDQSGKTFYSCGDDKLIKQWALEPNSLNLEDLTPINTIVSPNSLTGIDHHWVDSQFATSGDVVTIWDSARSASLHTYKWGADSILCVKFNPAEACLLASSGSDRGVCLYDLRAPVPMRKFILSMNSNKIAWNPQEPFNFVLANEDHNVYSFDMRNLDKALMVHKDHVGAVLDVCFSPTGREFVSGGYDRMVRIFRTGQGRSREAYHTKRMQRVFCVNYSSDAKYVLSGSDDTNVRVWKSEASDSIALQTGREERKKLYLNTLKKRFRHMPELKRMDHEKKLPKAIKKAHSLLHTQRTSERRKVDNRKRHSSSEGDVTQPERKKAVLKQLL